MGAADLFTLYSSHGSFANLVMFHIQVSNPLSGWKILDVMSVLSVPVLWDVGAFAKHASEELEWIVRVSE